MAELFSEQQTIDRYQQPSVQHLINENKMKDLALSKATNLIQLLNIQLEVERNSHQENIRLIEQELSQKYQYELAKLRDQIDALHREINRNASVSNSNQKTIRQPYVRASSMRSFDRSRKRSINKKYTQKNMTVESNQKPQYLPCPGVKQQFLRQKVLEMEQWKTDVVQQLNQLVTIEYNQLSTLINAIESCSDDFQSMASVGQKKNRGSVVKELVEVVRKQQNVINSLRAHSQELEDLYKSSHFKLLSFVEGLQASKDTNVGVQQAAGKIRKVLGKGRQIWSREVVSLQNENGQLKSILDGMIQLVKEEKGFKK